MSIVVCCITLIVLALKPRIKFERRVPIFFRNQSEDQLYASVSPIVDYDEQYDIYNVSRIENLVAKLETLYDRLEDIYNPLHTVHAQLDEPQ
ncbi:unnamed protein product [Enterobius vermicularis]|uniref:Transmembrane protein n=1 Tax=Enterobius vermicularis TaxID=51028 RepID=A0A0N4V5J8_ENTVE|nr:unnamed protein product [Enterobius vermicularis]